VVRVLAVSDVVDEALYADPSLASGTELILACGDLPFSYLGFLMNALDVPLVFVPGNHDPDISGYRTSRAGLTLRAGLPARPPWPSGAISADGRLVTVAGLCIAGLGGSRRYTPGPNQYTDWQQARRGRVLALRTRLRRRRVQVLLSHAPPAGVGDGPDAPHLGFPILNALIRELSPGLLLHGHVDPSPAGRGDHQVNGTIVRNVTGRHLFAIDPGTGAPADLAASQPGGRRSRTGPAAGPRRGG
jgi:Calcineurin-like phosphoesterase